MLVCPNCRGENPEEARFCSRCGRTLEPTHAVLLSRPQTDESTTELDVPPPKKPSPVPGIIALVVLGLALAGGGLWWLLRPDPTTAARPDACRGRSFQSPLNPYCVEVPEGWTGQTVRTSTGALDTFEPEAEASNVLVAVRAGSVVPGVTTAIYAQEIRSTQETVGLSLTPVRAIRVGGEIAAVWDFTARDQAGELIQQRHVVMVRGDLGWRITMTGQPPEFEEAIPPFIQLLSTWRFDYPVSPPPGGRR
ncbi:MAG TPA: zinc-ribbon domain-containing protein [Actinomycetota bacterium]|jgi:Double zinc ribbon|nr:zinc-ribbon domain-containing protein [Actinomycetota bacterium]